MAVKDLLPWMKRRNSEKRFAQSSSPFVALHREVNRTFDNFLRDFEVPGRSATAWPSIEISETDDEIKVVAELAGLEHRDVDVTLADGVLRLKGQKSLEKNGTVYSERWEGAFERMIPVGQDVDPGKVKASFKSGLLTVRLAKKPEGQRQKKRITVQ